MTSATRRQFAFMLVELIVIVGVGLLLVGLVSKLVIDAVYLQRMTVQHANRMALIDAFTEQMRRDLALTTAYAADAAGLTLFSANSEQRSETRYAINASEVLRTAEGRETHRWKAIRLGFTWRIERGPRADLLWLDFIEQPPPRATRLRDRTFRVSFLLPPGSAAQPAEGED